MNWEEIILTIRKDPQYTELVHDSYFGADLVDCVERYRHSEEFLEVSRVINNYLPGSKLHILDLGAGNGISSVAFALNGHHVVALEPDPSDTVGAGAIRWLKAKYNLTNLEVEPCFAEDLKRPPDSFDLVFARQSMHHAYNLHDFVSNSTQMLKKGGLFFTIRDHVVNDESQKKEFLDKHPLHKFYGGENAFSVNEYLGAMKASNLKPALILGPYDSVINYFPETKEAMKSKMEQKFHLPFKMPMSAFEQLLSLRRWLTGNYHKHAGRLFSFVAIKS